LDQFLLDEWFARQTLRRFEDDFSISKGGDFFFSHNPLTVGKKLKQKYYCEYSFLRLIATAGADEMSCYQPGLLLFELIFKNLWEKN
jgi:hypothetical protein